MIKGARIKGIPHVWQRSVASFLAWSNLVRERKRCPALLHDVKRLNSLLDGFHRVIDDGRNLIV